MSADEVISNWLSRDGWRAETYQKDNKLDQHTKELSEHVAQLFGVSVRLIRGESK